MRFGPKTGVPENISGREYCWPYLIEQHPLSPVFRQKRPGAPGNSYFAQLPPVFGHLMFRFWPFDVTFRWATRLHDEQINTGNNFGGNQLYLCLSGGYSRSFMAPARTTTRTYSKMSTGRCIDCRRSRRLVAEQTLRPMFPPKPFDCSGGLAAFRCFLNTTATAAAAVVPSIISGMPVHSWWDVHLSAWTPSSRQPCHIYSHVVILRVRTDDADVKVSTTQCENYPSFFIVRMSSWVKERTMHKQMSGVQC